MKIDKELLLKHKFWIILLSTVLLSVFCIFALMGTVTAEIASKKKKLEDQIKAFNAIKEVYTVGMIEEKKKEADKLKAEESKVWAEAYEKQKPISSWPKELEDRFDFQQGKFAYHIKVLAKPGKEGKGEPAKGDAPSKGAEGEPAPKLDRVVTGVIKELDKDMIEVKDETDNQVHKFFRTPHLKISGDEQSQGALYFRDLEPGWKVTVYFNKGKYFLTDGLTDSERGLYTNFGVYNTQIHPILRQVQPMDEKGWAGGSPPRTPGVVQLKGWWYDDVKMPPAGNKFLTYVSGGWVKRQLDISEEAWLAQEDIWVQTELYRLIRLANDYVSKLEGKGGSDKAKTYTFKNPYWEMALKYPTGNELQIEMKNLQDRRQRLDVHFKIRFDETFEPEIVLVGGEPLNPRGTEGSSRSIPIKLKDGHRRTGIYGVEQVLTWETAAIKRIDQISIGSLASSDVSHGHRTFPEGLSTFQEKGKKVAAPAADKGGGPGAQPPPDGKDKEKDEKNTDVGPHGVNKRRYVDVTNQARRVPVALCLIVDQYHVDRVHMAFANSNLRFLMTQVLLNRYPQSVRPALPLGTQKEGKEQEKGGIGDGLGGVGGSKSGAAGGGDDQEANMEMVLYGIVTLYERFPPINRPAADGKQ